MYGSHRAVDRAAATRQPALSVDVLRQVVRCAATGEQGSSHERGGTPINTGIATKSAIAHLSLARRVTIAGEWPPERLFQPGLADRGSQLKGSAPWVPLNHRRGQRCSGQLSPLRTTESTVPGVSDEGVRTVILLHQRIGETLRCADGGEAEGSAQGTTCQCGLRR